MKTSLSHLYERRCCDHNPQYRLCFNHFYFIDINKNAYLFFDLWMSSWTVSARGGREVGMSLSHSTKRLKPHGLLYLSPLPNVVYLA